MRVRLPLPAPLAPLIRAHEAGGLRNGGHAGVFLLFTAVPLAVAPGLAQPFLDIKWYALAILSAGWLLTGMRSVPTAPCPTLVRRHSLAVAALVAIGIFNAVRGGLAWSLEP